MAKLLHRPAAEFLPELKGTIFLNPQTKRWETEDEYLSGNVRAKLTVAEAAALADEQFHGNVEALRQVQPADLNATEIDGRLGSTWIPAEDVQKFAQEALGEEDITVSHAPQLGLWVVRGGYGVRFSVANTTECGTDRRSALELIEDALNLRVPTVYDHHPDTDRDVINGSATEAARDKQEKLKERFKPWLWQDDERRERLVRRYNDEFNHTRLRTFNGGSPDAARCQRRLHPPAPPEGRRVAHFADAQLSAGPGGWLGKDRPHGVGGDGIAPPGSGAQASHRGAQSHAGTIRLRVSGTLSGC